jgi:hypothetical protein
MEKEQSPSENRMEPTDVAVLAQAKENSRNAHRCSVFFKYERVTSISMLRRAGTATHRLEMWGMLHPSLGKFGRIKLASSSPAPGFRRWRG